MPEEYDEVTTVDTANSDINYGNALREQPVLSKANVQFA